MIARTSFVTAAVAALACACMASPPDPLLDPREGATSEGALGTERSAIVAGWSASWAPSVAALVDAKGGVRCSATLLTPRALLTAAHCDIAGATHVLFGERPSAPGAVVIPLASIVKHPEFDFSKLANDIAIAVLATPAPPSVWPATISRTPLGQDFVGKNVALIGYGLDGPRGTHARRGGLAKVTALEPTTFKTTLEPSQPCGGDSGGAALVESNTQTIVLGVISSGDSGCASHATYVRLDAYLASFVDPTLAHVQDGAARIGELCYHERNCAGPTSRCYAPRVSGARAYCTATCTSDASCPSSMRCAPTERGESECIYAAPPGTAGAPCDRDAECSTRQCTRRGGTAVCSVPCIPDVIPCEAGARCAADGDRFACEPEAPTRPAVAPVAATPSDPPLPDDANGTPLPSHAACGLAARPSHHTASGAFAAFLVFAAAMARRRRLRHHTVGERGPVAQCSEIPIGPSARYTATITTSITPAMRP